MSAAPVRRIVILGGGTAGWMAAAALSRLMSARRDITITLVESDAIGTVGVGEATIPPITQFNAMVGIDEAEFVRETQATYKLGIEFVDWTRIGHRYIHPFGTYGVDMNGVPFHHYWLKGCAMGETAALDAYSIAAMGGAAGRFAHPRPDQPGSPLSQLRYAFQFDAALYARYLRRLAEGRGAVRVEGQVADIARNPESGHVASLGLDGGQRIEGDLFVDCSGFRALLIGDCAGSEFVDWSHWLPCDRALAVPCEIGGDHVPLTRATARPSGWQWRIPLQHRIGNGYVYSSAHLSDDEAAATLLANLDGAPLADPRQLHFRAGHRRRAWVGNVVALGLAGGFLEPLESTSIHLVQTGIARLIALFPDMGFDPMLIDRYNAELAREYVGIRDFLILHYMVTERSDTPFWDSCRNLTPPEGVAEKLALFRATGRIFSDYNELFAETNWLAVMVGQGIVPGTYHPLVDALDGDATRDRLAHIRDVVAQTARAMPGHADFLSRIGCAPAPLRTQVA